MERVAFSVLGIDIYWYGFLSAIAALIGYYVSRYFYKNMNLDALGNYFILGLLVGGRLGYFVFYAPNEILDFFLIRQGGLAFHGAFLGVVLAVYVYSICYKHPFLKCADAVSLSTPLGLFAGRIGNYINQEIIGKPTAMFLSGTHPVAIYEAFLEGIVLFIILFMQAKKGKIKNNGYIASSFVLWYGIFRTFIEIFRMPDGMFGVFSIGQILSIPMVIVAIIFRKFYLNK